VCELLISKADELNQHTAVPAAKNSRATAKENNGANLGKEIFFSVLNTHSRKRKLDSDVVMADVQ
jgi:hypothetical protein